MVHLCGLPSFIIKGYTQVVESYALAAVYSYEYICPETMPIGAIYLPTTDRSTLCFGHRDYLQCVYQY